MKTLSVPEATWKNLGDSGCGKKIHENVESKKPLVADPVTEVNTVFVVSGM